MSRRIVKRGAEALASVLLLGIALYLLDWDGLKHAFSRGEPGSFIVATLLTILIFPVLGLRWYRIVNRLAPSSLGAHLKSYFYATFLNSFTPANIGGDVYRWASLRRFASASPGRLVVPLARERIIGLVSYLLAYLLLFPFVLSRVGSSGAHIVWIGAAVAVTGVLGILAAPAGILGPILRSERVQSTRRIETLLHYVRDAMHFDSWIEFVWLVAWSALGVVLWVAAVYVIANGLGARVPVVILGIVVVTTELVRSIPITIQGIGLREGTFAYLFAMFGQDAETGFAVGTLSYLALSCAVVAIALIGWSAPGRREDGRAVRS